MNTDEQPSFWLNKNILILAIIFLFCLTWWKHDRPVSQPDGVIVAESPIQRDYTKPQVIYDKDGVVVSAVADFRIRARVLSKERYRLDGGAWFAPWDFALGWGAMSDNRVIKKININQGGRFYFYSYPYESGLNNDQISPFSSNMHLAPADSTVSHMLGRAKVGDIVVLQGKLVNVQKTNGWRWSTSMSRTDTGPGACELVWVEAAVIE